MTSFSRLDNQETARLSQSVIHSHRAQPQQGADQASILRSNVRISYFATSKIRQQTFEQTTTCFVWSQRYPPKHDWLFVMMVARKWLKWAPQAPRYALRNFFHFNQSTQLMTMVRRRTVCCRENRR